MNSISTILFTALLAASMLADIGVSAWTPPFTPSTNKAKGASAVSQRNEFLRQLFIVTPSAALLTSATMTNSQPANAAPPFAIMAEEMGYFPIKDEKSGETFMVPAKAKRESTDQAIALAKYLQSTNSKMYGAFWCPHCQRQKELFGKEAWKYVTYLECSPKGYKSKFATCIQDGIDGYPSWSFGNGKSQGGEMELAEIAKLSGYSKKNKFDGALESVNGVPTIGGGSCQ